MNRSDTEMWICTTQEAITAKGDGGILSDIVDAGTAIFAPEALPIVAPVAGAVGGGIDNGLKGALIGGAEGAVAGQLGGTGDLAPLSDPTGGSAINQLFTGAGDFLSNIGSGATSAVGDAGTAISTPAVTTATGAEVPGVTFGQGLNTAAPATSLVAPPPALSTTLGGGVSDLTAGAGGAVDSSGLANVASTIGGAGPSDIAAGESGAGTNYSLSSAAGYPLSVGDMSTPLGTLGAQAAANPTATAAAPAAAAAKPSTFDQFVSNVGSGNIGGALGNIGTAAANNPGAVLGALGLGYQALTTPSVPKAAQAPAITADQLALANQSTAGATALEAPLTTGVLPPGAQAAIDQATNAAKQRVIANYASRGMDVGKDANGNYTNASLIQDLNAIDQQAAGQVFQYADQLYQQGLSQAQISEGLYNAILQNTTAQNKTMSDAISNFVTAAAGGGRPTVNINTGGAPAAAA